MARILVVDDSKEMTDLLHDMLEHSGHEAVAANSAVEAKQILEKNTFQIMITDILMPDMPGYDLIDQVFSAESTSLPPMKIIAISGGVHGLGKTTVLDAMVKKVDMVLGKPFSQEQIDAAIEALLAA